MDINQIIREILFRIPASGPFPAARIKLNDLTEGPLWIQGSILEDLHHLCFLLIQKRLENIGKPGRALKGMSLFERKKNNRRPF